MSNTKAQKEDIQVIEEVAQTIEIQANEKMIQSRLVQVIETVVERCGETEDAPKRVFAQYWHTAGNLLGEVEITN